MQKEREKLITMLRGMVLECLMVQASKGSGGGRRERSAV